MAKDSKAPTRTVLSAERNGAPEVRTFQFLGAPDREGRRVTEALRIDPGAYHVQYSDGTHEALSREDYLALVSPA